MNCSEFEHWLITRDIFRTRNDSEAMEHTGSCDACRLLYELDVSLESRIAAFFTPENLSENLLTEIDSKLENPGQT